MNEDIHTLSPSDRFCLQSAELLHQLQNYKVAEFELSHISPEQLDHPDVLHLRCRVYWGVRNIPMALSTASQFIEKRPNHPFGYVFKAQMLQFEGRPRQAFELLLGVYEKFPGHNGIPFVMAECAAQESRWSEAIKWLTVAFSISPYLKAQALDVKVFEPIRSQIAR